MGEDHWPSGVSEILGSGGGSLGWPDVMLGWPLGGVAIAGWQWLGVCVSLDVIGRCPDVIGGSMS